jgi:hypothetical protein
MDVETSGRPRRVRKLTEKMAIYKQGVKEAEKRKDARLVEAVKKAEISGEVDDLAELLQGMGVSTEKSTGMDVDMGMGRRRRRHTRRHRKSKKTRKH